MNDQRKFGIAPSGNETHDLLLKVGGTIIMGNLTTLTKGHRGSRLQCLRGYFDGIVFVAETETHLFCTGNDRQ